MTASVPGPLCSHAARAWLCGILRAGMIARLDSLRPDGLTGYLIQHHAAFRGTPLEPVLEPRRIQAPHGFHPARCIAAGLFLLLGESRVKDRLSMPQVPSEIAAHGIAYQVIRHRVTAFFVREEFARAVAATELPHDFTLDDLHWPLPGMVVAFPPAFMREYANGSNRDLAAQ